MFVSPALGGESFGLVLVEAFATATPVVASDIPGFADVADAGRGRRSSRPATSARSPTRSSALLADEERRVAMGRAAPRARRGALLVGRRRAAARGDCTSGRPHESARPAAARRSLIPARRCSSVAIALIWWRGPDWHLVRDAFTAVSWQWVVAAVGLNLLSVVVRAVAWHTVIKQAMPPPHPRFRIVFSAFCVGLFANVVLPGRVGELARVAVLARRMPERQGDLGDADRLGLRAPRCSTSSRR